MEILIPMSWLVIGLTIGFLVTDAVVRKRWASEREQLKLNHARDCGELIRQNINSKMKIRQLERGVKSPIQL